jgi:hypothetical protein
LAISSTVRTAGPYSGNGVTTVFAFAFKVFLTSDLQVVKNGADGIDVPLVLTTDYSVTLNPNQDAAPGGS